MKISELIKQLQQIEKDSGDIEVGIYDTMDYSANTDVIITLEKRKAHPDDDYQKYKYLPNEKYMGRTQAKFRKRPLELIAVIKGDKWGLLKKEKSDE